MNGVIPRCGNIQAVSKVKIAVDRIVDKPFVLEFEEPLGTFEMLAALEKDQACHFEGPVCGKLTAVREFDHIRVNGQVSVPIMLSCSRCLIEYETRIESRFTVIYRKDSSEHHDEEEETELADQALISSTYSGDEIDLTHEIEEQVAMEIPIKPLCSESCKGLCHVCGTDLNQNRCSCGNHSISMAFSALKDFKVSR